MRIPRIMQQTSKVHLQKGRSIGLVPTMGALHDGHLSLVKRARMDNDIVVVSVFVNPLQFGPTEDFDRYPRDIDRDKELLKKFDVEVFFLPDLKLMYPDPFSTTVTVNGCSEKLCGLFRPGHFAGVATVVCKLFNQVKPTRAYFGQKDYQQTVVIRRMAEDLNMDTEIVVCQTIREADGLALSSRNVYLKSEERQAAPLLYKALQASARLAAPGTATAQAQRLLHDTLRAEPLITEVQYAGIYDPETLEELAEFRKRNLLALAVKMGGTRLIDNLLVE